MASKLMDNLLKVIQGVVVMTGVTTASLEVDLELPRGFVAKIRMLELRAENLSADFSSISIDKEARIAMALVLDPDDAVSVSIPTNNVQHDVLADHEVDLLLIAGTAGDGGLHISEYAQMFNFDANGLDVITARNMRFNANGVGADAADLTASIAQCSVWYTLEKITDTDILNLLDIL